LLVRARVNGGPLLRLLLDSGAQHVVLSRRSAAKSGCAGGTDLSLVSPGAAVPSAAKSVRAETIQVGDFVARDVDVLVTDNKVAEGVDGVLPLALFGGFVIRLDMPSKSLDLDPYPEQAPRQTGDLAAVRNHDLLFVKCQVNGARDGYFLLDTGASYNAISRALARTLNSSDLFGSDISLRGGTVPVDARLTSAVTRLRIGTLELMPAPLVSVDLSLASRYHRLEISGLIGYPALRGLALVVNYRDGLVRVASK
jgi:predicted aspartyl protease